MHFKSMSKLVYLLLSCHGEALQAARHVAQALLEGCHQVSLQTRGDIKI